MLWRHVRSGDGGATVDESRSVRSNVRRKRGGWYGSDARVVCMALQDDHVDGASAADATRHLDMTGCRR